MEAGSKALGAVVHRRGKDSCAPGRGGPGDVEETLNALLEAGADHLCRARKYERSEDRNDTRAASYDRQLRTNAADVTLQVPKLRSLPFETAIIERHRRRETSVQEALIEMYLARVSGRRVGRHPAGDVGYARVGLDGERSEPEDLQADRGVPAAPAGGRFPLCVAGRPFGRSGAEAAR